MPTSAAAGPMGRCWHGFAKQRQVIYIEKIHIVKVSLAVRYGLEEAILLKWFAKNLEPEQARDFWYARGGEYWLRLSIRQLQAEFPYFSSYVLKRTLASLEAFQLLKTEIDADGLGVLRKSKYMSYGLTSKAREVLEGE